MKKILLILLIVSVLLESKETDFLRVDDLKKGFKGFGLTSFLGTGIDTFYVEILDVLKGTGTGHNLILARLSGEKIEKIGVASGMSGSPVFIDGKILGAVAYAWPFSKEPICGIMPFEDMKNMAKTSSFEGIIPIKGLLSISGISYNEFIDSISRKISLEIVPGGLSKKDVKIEPGAPCGIILAYGDAIVSIFGTLTYVDDKYIYAFGHPVFSSGNVKLPFAMGEVNAVLPSIYSSFKISSPSSIVGAVIFDGPNGIICKIGENADVIECRMRFRNLEKKYFIANVDFIFKNIFSSLLFNNIIEYLGNNFEGAITVMTKFYTENDSLIYENYSSSGGRILILDIYEYIDFLLNNDVSRIEIKKVDVEIKEDKRIKEYLVKDFILRKEEIKPNEKIKLKIVMERYRDTDTTIDIDIDAPSIVGDYYILVSSERDYYFEEKDIKKRRGEIIRFLKNIPDFNIFSVNIINEKNKTISITKRLTSDENYTGNYVLISKKKINMDGNVSGSKRKKIRVRW